MTCAFADWSQRRFPVESAGLPLFPPHSSQNNTWLHSGTRPRSQAISRSRSQLS